MKKSVLIVVLMLGVVGLLTACGGGSDSDSSTAAPKTLVIKTLNPADKIADYPSNITVAFKVETSDGQPVAGLQTGDYNANGMENQNFEIWEDGNKISQDESQAKIDPDTGDFDYYVYLLLDLSQSILSNSLEETKQGAATLVENLFSQGFRRDNLRIKIAFFDGNSAVHIIQDFSNDKETLLAEINNIDSTISSDGSTNLYGAVISAVKELNTTLQDSQSDQAKYIAAGSLVVFTDGTDQANRRSFTEVLNTIKTA
ncbi:MAG: VWA domain-containing protein, partial [Gammaproteobacteria bacterium]|nr:VWA domain-containing protein [Gammaproteobacteria bacterium]